MGSVKILFWFDVEDFINEESEEAFLGLLDVLDSRGVIGIFKLVGEKTRMLERRGRRDILDRLAGHEVGYHTDFHSLPPVVTTYLEKFDFREGAEEFARREEQGFADVRRITGQDALCYGQPGLSWAPQTYATLNHWGVPVYLNNFYEIDIDGKPFWYGGLLSMTSLTGLMHIPMGDDLLGRMTRRFDELCEAQKDEETAFISMFYHPTEFVFEQYWDAVNFARGKNPPKSEWVKPPKYGDGVMESALEQVGQFIDYTLSKGNVSYIGNKELLELERTKTRVLTKEEVLRYASSVGTEVDFVVDGDVSLSPGELFWAFRQFLLGEEALPELVYGPQRPFDAVVAEGFAAGTATAADALAALRAEWPSVFEFRQLPDSFNVGDAVVSPETMYCAMAEMIRGGLSGEDTVSLREASLATMRHVKDNMNWPNRWIIFPENQDVTNTMRMSRLQTWTLKPAIF
ncbi:hypothetical protein [Paenibacillus sp. HB172176]|uniref:hypothetical protein n=1 Tax=Paenibacillus sp. HB172176 TaxID=2493690 RepID=UPI00143B3B39|nr:hypothetical protein [Paenibacillus sp. HB172176]